MEPRPVGVAGDQGHLAPGGVRGKALLRPVFTDIVFSGAGRVQYAEMFQRPPEVAHQKTCQLPEGGI